MTEQNNNQNLLEGENGNNNQNLTEGANGNNITDTATGNTDSANNTGGNTPNVQQSNAGGNTPNANDAIIAQQAAQIEALIARTQSLTEQINRLVTMGGVQINDGSAGASNLQPNAGAGMQPNAAANNTGNLPEGYKSLKDLGAEIGKR